MADYSSPTGVIPKLNALMHRWQSRKGRPAADEGSLPLGREATRGEKYAASNVQRDIDASERPNPLDLLMGGLGPAQAMFLGPMAKMAPLDRISKAQDLANRGLSAEEIYKATGAGHGALPGISFGKEGLPRWEISDAMTYIKPVIGPSVQKHGKGGREFVKYEAENFIEHPELFNQYPQLRGVPVSVRETGRASGRYLPTDAEIFVEGPNPTSWHDTVLHELQHVIQEIEGFAKGGSPAFMRDVAQNKAVELGTRIENMEKEFFRRNKLPEYLGDLTDAEARKYDAFRSTPTYKTMQDEWFKFLSNLDNDKEMARLYHRLAGEAEARNVQERAPLSYPERAALSPQDTEDIPRSLQILFMR